MVVVRYQEFRIVLEKTDQGLEPATAIEVQAERLTTAVSGDTGQAYRGDLTPNTRVQRGELGNPDGPSWQRTG